MPVHRCWSHLSGKIPFLCVQRMMGDTLTAKVDGRKTESQVTESTREVGSPQCARKESRSRVSRPQCPSVCHQFTLSLGHMWNDHLNNSVVHKTCVNSCHKISSLSGCEPVSPSYATDSSSCEGISCTTLPEIADFDEIHWSISVSSPVSHCHSTLMHNCRGTGISSWRQYSCVIVAWPFDVLVVTLTNSYPMRLMSCSILALGICFVHKSAGFTLVSTFFVANQPDLEAFRNQRFCASACFALPSPLRLTKSIVAETSKCRFSLQDIPRSSPRFGSRALLRPS